MALLLPIRPDKTSASPILLGSWRGKLNDLPHASMLVRLAESVKGRMQLDYRLGLYDAELDNQRTANEPPTADPDFTRHARG
jgi:hypothetical protein